ncbi:hypothetical protein J5N97_019517 [Dioscorea zingiberensis]|uniref:Uncharacterized protein n=1 Tax=Dioscorea zingiberensis TaxID=325984 RepID=A0A9D5CF56_9LILI|nr:hypothetical protein J5N97_019517 [Dioscorea zingiberensis]
MASMKATRPVGIVDSSTKGPDVKAPSASKQPPKKAEPKASDSKKKVGKSAGKKK